MVEKFQKILADIEATSGKVTLLALLKMDALVDKWTIVLCAPWASDDKRDEAFNIIRNEIRKILTPEELSEFSIIAIYSKGEHLIQELLQYQSGAEVGNKPINGNIVHSGKIIVSNPNI